MANAFLKKDGSKSGVWFGRNYYDLDDGISRPIQGIRPYIHECQEYFIEFPLPGNEFPNLLRTCETALSDDYSKQKSHWMFGWI